MAWIFYTVSCCRRWWLSRRQVAGPVPVIVVGNISVGGNGKTPIVIELVRRLQRCGIKVGVVSRGYGGWLSSDVRRCFADSNPNLLGDEPVLIAKRSGAIVVVGRNRVQAVTEAARLGCQLIVADDGLQHYAMARALEIAVVGSRHNGYLLPAGPLREPVKRLQQVDWVMGLQDCAEVDFPTTLHSRGLYAVFDDQPIELACLQGQPIVAVCGIANPQRFYQQLSQLGLVFDTQVFADHHRYQSADLPKDGWIIMTEKDAVKCRPFANARMVYLAIEVSFSDEVLQRCLALSPPNIADFIS